MNQATSDKFPLINILIRNKYRPQLLRRTLESIVNQGYPALRIIMCSDTDEALSDGSEALISTGIRYSHFLVHPTGDDHYWNLYCNQLKKEVYDGWFVFLDNDDYLRPGSLKEIAQHLDDPAQGVICQFIRNKRPKPNDTLIRNKKILKGLIGGSCIILHQTHKYLAEWQSGPAADYRFIKAVSEKLPLKFVPVVVAIAGNGGLHGK